MKECIYCGAELPDEAKACSNCGRPLPMPEEPPADSHPADSPASAEETGQAETAGRDTWGSSASAGQADSGAAWDQDYRNTSASDTPVNTGTDGQSVWGQPAQNGWNSSGQNSQDPWGQTDQYSQNQWGQGTSDGQNQWGQDTPNSQNQWGQGASNAQNQWGQDTPNSQNQWGQGASNAQNQWGQGAPDGQNQWNQGAPNSQGQWNQGVPNTQGQWGQGAHNGQPWANGRNSWNGQAYGTGVPVRRVHGMAIAALVLGVLSLFLNSLYFIPSLLAIGFGIAALLQIRKNPQYYSGSGLAIAGIVLGAVFLIVYIALFLWTAHMMQDPEFMKLVQQYMEMMGES